MYANNVPNANRPAITQTLAQRKHATSTSWDRVKHLTSLHTWNSWPACSIPYIFLDSVETNLEFLSIKRKSFVL